MQAYAIDLLKRLDTNQNGVISFQEFSNGLKT
jgi:Ca2+-binding EF-hand superfamily protein